MASGEPYEWASGLTDAEWLDVLAAPRSADPEARRGLPSLPSERIQAKYTGRSGRAAFEQAVASYRFFRDKASELGVEPGANTQVLDLGCGWGRLSQTILKDFPAGNIVSLDVAEEPIRICTETELPTRLVLVPDAQPPSSLADESIDLVISFSVFSHLSEASHWRWLEELHRVMRPGGVAALTTRGRFHIDLFERNRRQGGKSPAWKDVEAAKRTYDQGDFLFDEIDRHQLGSDYGEAAIPEQYVHRNWTKLFPTTRFYDTDVTKFGQAVIMARKD